MGIEGSLSQTATELSLLRQVADPAANQEYLEQRLARMEAWHTALQQESARSVLELRTDLEAEIQQNSTNLHQIVKVIAHEVHHEEVVSGPQRCAPGFQSRHPADIVQQRSGSRSTDSTNRRSFGQKGRECGRSLLDLMSGSAELLDSFTADGFHEDVPSQPCMRSQFADLASSAFFQTCNTQLDVQHLTRVKDDSYVSHHVCSPTAEFKFGETERLSSAPENCRFSFDRSGLNPTESWIEVIYVEDLLRSLTTPAELQIAREDLFATIRLNIKILERVFLTYSALSATARESCITMMSIGADHWAILCEDCMQALVSGPEPRHLRADCVSWWSTRTLPRTLDKDSAGNTVVEFPSFLEATVRLVAFHPEVIQYD
jgi:hypothetical protein